MSFIETHFFKLNFCELTNIYLTVISYVWIKIFLSNIFSQCLSIWQYKKCTILNILHYRYTVKWKEDFYLLDIYTFTQHINNNIIIELTVYCIVNTCQYTSAWISPWRYYRHRIHPYQFSIEKFRYTRVSGWPKSAKRGV